MQRWSAISSGEAGSLLLTGGAGFFGEHLARRLVGDGWRVRVLDHADEPAWSTPLGVSYGRGDVNDAAEVAAAVDGVDAVVHAAFARPGQAKETLRSVNVGGTRKVLSAARAAGCRRVVLVSSTIVDRPLRPHPVLREAAGSRLYDYRQSRREAEEEALAAAGPEMSVALARPKTFLGPGGVTAFAGVFELVRQGRTVPLPGRGDNRYQLLDVRDLAAGLALLAASPASGTFSFGASTFGTVAEDLARLVAHAGTGARLRPLPASFARAGLNLLELVGVSPLSEWHHHCARGRDGVVDISPAVEALGWTPLRSNVDALVAAYDWYVAAADGGGSPRPIPTGHRRLVRAGSALLSSRRPGRRRTW